PVRPMRIQAYRHLDSFDSSVGLTDVDLVEAAIGQGVRIVGVQRQRQIELSRRLAVVAAPELAPAKHRMRQMVDFTQRYGLLRKTERLFVALFDRSATPVRIERRHVMDIGET